ncbi:MAG: metal ABC transporter permease [Crocinitomicaceae bacterium]|nr:metal ABC transporter permease [Crocinitomicaceae bacterium]
MFDIWTIITASTVACTSAILGSFLVLRKKAMVGDAISHSVLPGIVLAYMVSQSRASWVMLIGAAIFGVLTNVLIEFLNKKAKMTADASIGITFTWLFAIGVILLAYFTAGGIDLDQECVLFGEISMINLDKIVVDENLYLGPTAFWFIFPVFILVLLFTTIGFKGLKITSFNEDYAASLGIKNGFWNYSLMALVSLSTVMSFESVGAILVVGLLVIPPASAYLLTKKLKVMIFLGCLFGIMSSVIGFYIAKHYNLSISGCIVCVAGLIFLVNLVYSIIQSKSKRNISIQQ